MKIWIAIAGKTNHYSWSNWLADVCDWVSDELLIGVSSYKGPSIAMAEIEYDFNHKGYTQKNLEYNPCIIDGWIRNEQNIFNAYKDDSRESHNKLYSLMNRDIDTFINSSNGEFNFLFWNSKTEELYVCNDIYGLKPVYYWLSNSGELYISNDLR